MLDGCLLVLIQMHLDQLRSVQLDTNTLSNDFCWKDEVIEDVIVNSGQGTATWTLLFVWVWATATWFRENLALSTEHNMTAGEFLLQFTNQTGLYLLESLLLWNWNVNDDCLKYIELVISSKY